MNIYQKNMNSQEIHAQTEEFANDGGVKDRVINLAQRRLKKELASNQISAAMRIIAPYILKAREVSFIADRHQNLMDMPQELRNEFIDNLARETVNPTLLDRLKKSALKSLPGMQFFVTLEDVKNGSLAIMLLSGMIGDEETQERFATHTNPGKIELLMQKALPWLAKLDIEPDTRAILEMLIIAFKAKTVTIDALKKLREEVKKAESDPESRAAIKNTLEQTECDANYAALMPATNNKKTAPEINMDNSLGPINHDLKERSNQAE